MNKLASSETSPLVVVLDHYDSFVHNLARYLRLAGLRTLVHRADAITIDELRGFEIAGLVLSPGPKTPHDGGIGLEVLGAFSPTIPTLGVCLGHQAIGCAFGGELRRSEPVHGIATEVHHDGTGLFTGLPSPLPAGRYHSLSIDRSHVPADLQINAWTPDGTIMGVRHRRYPIDGLQFHPESVLTPHGQRMIDSFANQVRMSLAGHLRARDDQDMAVR